MITPRVFDFDAFMYSQLDEVLFFTNPDGSPTDVTGWTFQFQARTEPGAATDAVNVTPTSYTSPGFLFPSGALLTIPAPTMATLTSPTPYRFYFKVTIGGVPYLAATGFMRVTEVPPP